MIKNLSLENQNFIKTIRDCLSPDSLNEVLLTYNGEIFSIEPVEKTFHVKFLNSIQVFNNVDEIFEKCIINGKTFLEIVDEIDFY